MSKDPNGPAAPEGAADQEESLQLERELAAEAAMRAQMHRYMGFTATILVLIAVWVALARMEETFGVSPLSALGEGLQVMPFILLILGGGMLAAMLPMIITRLSNRKRRDR